MKQHLQLIEDVLENGVSKPDRTGPGIQWRSWPDGKGGHIDQIACLIEGLKNCPGGRRHLFRGSDVAYLISSYYPTETKLHNTPVSAFFLTDINDANMNSLM